MMMMMVYYLRGILEEIEIADYIFGNTDNIYFADASEKQTHVRKF